ncbi:hypothetical protein ABE425_22370, partial [Chryseobacterium cucumeris]|uniref:hypothetical protein n=1 Tax=Chryseobacterium cucumeris TaxID=1813611 RepID=UPI00320881D3
SSFIIHHSSFIIHHLSLTTPTLALIEMVTPQLASEGGWVLGVEPFGFAQGDSVGVYGREE